MKLITSFWSIAECLVPNPSFNNTRIMCNMLTRYHIIWRDRGPNTCHVNVDANLMRHVHQVMLWAIPVPCHATNTQKGMVRVCHGAHLSS